MNTSNTNLYPCIWVKDNARATFDFYAGIFENSAITDENKFVTSGKLEDTHFMFLNGNPNYQPNPSISFMVMSPDKEKISRYYESLKEGGSELMPLGKYEWSPWYAWITDKNGISWQLYTEDQPGTTSKRVVPTLMFGAEQQGKCTEAVKYFEDIFPDFKSDGSWLYPDGEMKDQVMHTQFYLNGEMLMAMDSGVPQTFTFNEAISLVVECEDQESIDHYWNNLTKEGKPWQCGWLADKYGISWQIVPKNIDSFLFNNSNAQANFEKMLKMTKIEMGEFE